MNITHKTQKVRRSQPKDIGVYFVERMLKEVAAKSAFQYLQKQLLRISADEIVHWIVQEKDAPDDVHPTMLLIATKRFMINTNK